MNEQNKEKIAKANEDTPPFTFRFANKKLKREVEKSAKRTHRTIAGVINRAIEVYLMTSKGLMV